MLNLLVLLAVVALAHGNDVIVGGNNTEGRKIFDEVRHANPTIWRQTETFTINTTDAEIISRVVITDLRPDKDGDAKILEGGEGQKNVTIELKSPTVLRGYDFQVEIYSIPENQAKTAEDHQTNVPLDQEQVRKQRTPVDFPKSKFNLDLPQTVFEDTKKIESTTGKNFPGSISTDTQVNVAETKTIDSDIEDNDDPITGKPALNPNKEVQATKNIENFRHTRETTTEAPKKVNEQITPKELSKFSTVRPSNDNGFVIHPEIDYPSSTLLSSTAQEEKRNARDTNTDDKTQPPVWTGESKTDEGSKTLLATETSTTQQPKTNVPSDMKQYSVPYPIRGTSTVGTINDRKTPN